MSEHGTLGDGPGLQHQIDQWRTWVSRRDAISPDDVAELEDNLRGRIADLRAGGLDDEEAFLDSFADDGYVDDWGRVFRGRAAIDAWSGKELIGAAGTLTVQSVSTTAAGEVVVVGDWRSDFANGLSRFTFALDGHVVASMTIREG